jgi:hypothetical protein
MEIQVKYSNLEDREIKVKEQEAKGLRMLHDDFSPDWKAGDEPHGTMTFTDVIEPSPPIKPVRDLAAEIDDLKTRVKALGRK